MITDILIIGGGLAGLNAAAEIRDNHPQLSVCIVDAGGCASTEIMGFSAPANPPDSPDVFYHDILNAAQGQSDAELDRILATRALPEMHRLEMMGLSFSKATDGSYDMVPAIGTTFPRVVHHATTTGRDAIRLLNITPVHKRIVQLVRSSHDGPVAAAITADGEPIRAKAIVLAGGGFAGLWKTSTWSKSLRGDALVMAMRIGAETTGLRHIQFEPTVALFPQRIAGIPIISTVLNEGGRLLDGRGAPLLPSNAQTPRKRELARLIQQTIDDGRADAHGGVTFDFSQVDEMSFQAKYPEYVRRYMPDGGSLHDLRISVKPAAHTTLGGLKISTRCETTVPALFAAGEITGGIHGKDRLGGNAGLEVFVFGRIAGEAAAQYAMAHRLLPMPSYIPETQTTPEQFASLADFLDSHITVSRCSGDGFDKIPSSPHKELISNILNER